MHKPRKEDFQVYELASADPDYKEYNGIIYNNFMYQEAIRKYKNLVKGGDLSGVSSRNTSIAFWVGFMCGMMVMLIAAYFAFL